MRALATAALALSWCATVAYAADRPLGERLSVAAAKYGLSPTEVAGIRSAAGEFACPGDGSDGARLNGWLISDDEVLTNSHGLVEGEEDPGHPYLRQPVARCRFNSFLDIQNGRTHPYLVNLDGLGTVFRRGAKAPVDPTQTVGGDLVKLHLARPVVGGIGLTFDPTPMAKGDALFLVSRVPTDYRTKALPGDDLLIARCTITALDPPSASYNRSVVTDCTAAPGMSAGIYFARTGGKLVAKGMLVAVEYVRTKDGDETVIGTHALMFEGKFANWLADGCAFWPAALRVSACGLRR